MFLPLTLALLQAATDAPARPRTDTTLAVAAGTQVDVSTFAGAITVRTWDKPQVRVTASHSSRDRVSVAMYDGRVHVRSSGRMGVSFSVDFELWVPTATALKLNGTYADITVTGTRGSIDAKTLAGDVRITGGADYVNASSVEGIVAVADARGKTTIKAVNKGVTLKNCSGAVVVEGVNGNITLDGIDSDDVEVSTLNGQIRYDGTIKDRGQYRFGAHTGGLSIAIPERANVTLSVVTYGGGLSADFPLPASDVPAERRRRTIVLGAGSARVDAESFQGGVRLRRPGARDRNEEKEATTDEVGR
ncbi:MAG: DUF4097 family beta strand repeat-containing protein [Gemmatimonadaceae bacterium]|nr:DUF4097 family beta strand repeat-containing protein [Gemmatimonadaceae bacterium]